MYTVFTTGTFGKALSRRWLVFSLHPAGAVDGAVVLKSVLVLNSPIKYSPKDVMNVETGSSSLTENCKRSNRHECHLSDLRNHSSASFFTNKSITGENAFSEKFSALGNV